MTLTPTAEDGFVLAAVLAGDRTLERVEGAIAPEWLERLRERARNAEQGRTQLVSALIERVRPGLRELAPTFPARAAALLASRVPQELARSLGPAPPTRPGFRPADELVPLLLRLARRAAEGRS